MPPFKRDEVPMQSANRNSKVLIIEDDRHMNNVLTRVIQKKTCHDVTSCFFLKEGLNMAVKGSYDVILLDVLMPDGNGLDSLGAILSVETDPEIIVLTGRPDSDSARKAIGMGAFDYLSKPGSMANILFHLHGAISRRECRKKNTDR